MGEDVTLSMIEGHENFKMVDVRCKVFLVKEPAAIGVNKGRMKQDIILLVIITGVLRVTLWEEHYVYNNR